MKNLRNKEQENNDEAAKKASPAAAPASTPTPASIMPEPSAGKKDSAEDKQKANPEPKKKKNPGEEKEKDFSVGKDDHPQKNDLEKYSHNLGTDKLVPDYSIGNFAKAAFAGAQASIGSMMSSPADTPNPSADLMSSAKGSGGGGKGTEAIVSKGIEAGANSVAPGSGKAVAAAAEKTGVTQEISHSFKP